MVYSLHINPRKNKGWTTPLDETVRKLADVVNMFISLDPEALYLRYGALGANVQVTF